MKTLALFSLLFVSYITSAQTTYIPDDNFEQALITKGYDYALDDYVRTSNISRITFLDVSNQNIFDLTGIEDFISLTDLWCLNNELTSLDVSQNTDLRYLLCSNNELTSLDVSQNTALIDLWCSNNRLTSLDVSQNTALTYLRCFDNDQLTSLDVRNGNNTSISYLDATNNPVLFCIQVDNETDANAGLPPYDTWLKDASAAYFEDCEHPGQTYVPDDNFEQALIDYGYDDAPDDYVLTTNISGVTFLNVSNPMTNPNLPNVTDKIADMTGIEDFISLTTLRCFDNELTSLDVSQNTALINLNCSNNQLTSLDVRNGNNSILQNFDATNNPSLTCIQIDNETGANAGLPPYDAWLKDATAAYFEDCEHPGQTYIPDDRFEQALIVLGYDDVFDDYVLTSNISEVTSLDVSNQNIFDLTGIEHFISLTTLWCFDNELTSLDVSQNTALTELRCYSNQLLGSLDVSQNTALTHLYCGNNIRLGSLDVSQNTDLTILKCYFNGLSSLDVSQNTALTQLDCSINHLTSLDVSQNTDLTQLDCFRNQLTSLDVSQNTALTHLWCYDNHLTSLDVSQNTALTRLRCYNNDQLTRIDVRNGNNTSISYLDATNNPVLFCIQVDNETDANAGLPPYDTWQKDDFATYSEDCPIFELTYVPDDHFEQALITKGYDDVPDDYVLTSNISGIIFLDVYNQNIADLTGIEDFIRLTNLDCSNNQLTSLDLSQNTDLEFLYCQNNQLTSLDVSQNTFLTHLDCSSNRLTSLDVRNGNNTYLHPLNATDNPSLFCIQVDNETDANLRRPPYNNWQKDDFATYSEDCSTVELTYVPDDNFEQMLIDLWYDIGLNDYVLTSNISGIPSLNVSSGGISDLTGIEDFTSLTSLDCYKNQLTSLDVSQNTALINLDCSYNQLTSLDVSQNTFLTLLDCSSNRLTSLDVRNGNNSILQTFDATNNPSLTCIQIDNETDANAGLPPYDAWLKDASAAYFEDCEHPGQTYVPDDNFERALITLGYDDAPDDYVLTTNISGVTSLSVYNQNIADLTGIEHFISLTNLDCSDNQLTSLDVSQNTDLEFLNCFYNQITSLDVSQNTALTHLWCYNNRLTSLDVRNGNNTSISSLYAMINPYLTCIQVDNETDANAGLPPYNTWGKDDVAFYSEDCEHPRQTYVPDDNFEQVFITLGYDDVPDDYVVTAIISRFRDLNVSSESISDLTGIEDFINLTYLWCKHNELTSLDVSQNTDLIYLDCSNNRLTSLDVSQNTALTELRCSYNDQLTRIDVRNGNNTSISYLDATNNPVLFCIQVDNEADANAGLPPYDTWQKDDFVTYSEDCSTVELTYVPDDNFEQALITKGYDDVPDDYVLTLNISGITLLDVSNQNIFNLTGIEDFISLTDLWCLNNELTSLDVSQNTALINLDCSNNQLTSLDVRNGNNTILLDFNATNNPSLFCIQVDNETDANFPLPPYSAWQKDDFATYSEDCSTLELTYVPDDNFEQALIDLGYDIRLDDYVLTSNISGITSLNVSNPMTNPNLPNVTDKIADMTGIEDFISLTDLRCFDNELTSLDVSQNTALINLNCSNNQLTSLNVHNGNNSILQYFHATNNPSLFCIQVDNETDANLRRPPYNAWQKDDFATYSEDCSTLELTYVPDDNFEQALIDLGYDIRLDDYVLTANISGVTFLNVSNPMTNPNLPNVTDKIADMTGIEDFISLTTLRCFGNELTSLDVSQNTALINLNCSNNQLTSLNVRNGNNSILQYFHATNNPSLFCIQVDNETDANFPLPPYDTWQKDDFATYSEDCSTLELTYVPDDNFEQALIDYGYDIGLNDYVLTSNISEVTSLDVSNQSIADLTGIEDFISLTFLNCGYNPLSSLDMSNNVALTTLICRYNQLKELEISQNTALTALVCISNNLSSLDVSQNISLIYLNCENNDLSSLDVSQNVALAHLQCGSNNIEVLDVSHNVALEQLWCGSNKLTNLDLSQNTALKLLYCSFNPLTQQLDVSNNTALEFIHCADIGLESLDVSLQPELFGLFCYINKLESLDLTNNPKLFELWCYNNRLAELNIKNGNNMNVTQFKANYNLLSCITVDDELFNHTGWITDPGVIFSNDCGYNTQRGESVEVLPVDETSQTTPVEVTFDAVNRSGNTSLATTDNGPEFPGGFAYGDPITYYDISTTAEFSGPVQIAIDYSGMVFANEEGLRLMHYENQQWNDVTTMLDTENDMIYGEVMMLSSFGIFEDIEPPVLIGVPADETVECNAIPTPAVVNAEDNVDGSVSVILSEETLGGSCPNSYTLVRTWTATDAAGNTSSASQIITVKDNTSPTLTVPADVTIECDMDNSPATTDMATATDNCDAAPVIVYSDEQIPGACANAYTINRTWSATDVCGNSASMVQVITIVDTEAPALTTPVDLTIECDMDSSPDATGYATTADNCDAAPVITYTDEQVVGSCANEYTINRIWMATDACSNVATAVQVISVIDVTIPVITEVPTAPIVKGNDAGSCGAFIDYPEITATDNCSDPVNLTLDPLSGSFFTVGSTTVTVTAVDDCGNTVTADFDVEITNEIPVIENLVAPVDPVQLGVIVNTSAVFTDNNLSGAVWDWGDGTSSAGIIEGQTITGDHLYEMPGVYILTLTITDMCGQTDTEIYQYVVVYDPNGGFITGGGWINSPPGAYVDDPLLEGKANFGFVSKYKKGEDIPEGNTEFQFSAGNLKFKSTSYYWLVIAGSKAKFKGDGSVNNTGDYGFIISAIDGDLKDNGEVDRFRIKIWDVVDETVIYDNEIESDENEDPTTQLGGGSIVIHIPKTKGSGIFNEELVSFESDGYNEPTMLIYPNPAKDNINIIVSGKEEQTIQLKIYNSTGQLIYISSGKGMINEEISLKDNKSGLYSVIAVVEGKLIIQKVLIE